MRRIRRRERPPREIVGLARIVKALTSSTFNVLLIFEELRKFFPKLRLRIVLDESMPDFEARAYPDQWLIKIRVGMYEGLLCGDPRARWTLIHELGHILLRHPGRLARLRDPAKLQRREAIYEREANKFAAAVLAPYDEARLCKNAGEIAAKFRINRLAAEIRLDELRLEEVRKRAALNLGFMPNAFSVETRYEPALERQVRVISTALSDSVEEANEYSSIRVEPYRNNLFATSVLTACASGLLLDAYESLRTERVGYEYRVAAALAKAILTVQPVRPIGQHDFSSDAEVLAINQRCALRAIGGVLGLRFAEVGKTSLGIPDYTDLQTFESTYLRSLVAHADKVIKDENTVVTFENFSRYEEYNADHDICWSDVHEIEFLIDIILLLVNVTDDHQTRH